MKKNMAYKYAKKSMVKKETASQERKNLLKDIPEEKTMARKNGDDKELKKGQKKTIIDVPSTTDSTAAYMQNMYNRDYGQGTKGNWSDIAAAAEKRYPGLQKAVGNNPPKGPDGNPNSIDYNVKKGREKYGLSIARKNVKPDYPDLDGDGNREEPLAQAVKDRDANTSRNMNMDKAPTTKMNKYDKDMMHERELIYDAKGQIHKADKEYKKGDKGKKQEMIHDREMIHDAKKEIHREDVAKKGSGHVVNRIAGRNSRG